MFTKGMEYITIFKTMYIVKTLVPTTTDQDARFFSAVGVYINDIQGSLTGEKYIIRE
jgi:hypothetical protein